MYPSTLYVCCWFTVFIVKASPVDPATCCIYLFINNFQLMLVLVVPGVSFAAFSDSAGSEGNETGSRIAEGTNGTSLFPFYDIPESNVQDCVPSLYACF